MQLTQIVNGQVTELILCEECAKKKGLFDPQSLAFAEKFFPEELKKKVEEIVKELYSLLMEGADRQKFDTFAKKHWDEKELDREYPKERDKVWKKVFPTVAKAKKSVRTEVVKTDSDYRGNVPYSVVKEIL